MTKKRQIPHTYVIVFFVVIFAAILTWFVPGGEFQRETININGINRSVVVNNSFHYTESHPQTWQVFSAIFNGFVDKADIIVFILIIGGAFFIMNDSKAIDVGIQAFLRKSAKLEKNNFLKKIGISNIILVSIMLIFSVFGAVFGMSEETIAFVIIFIPLSISMGYDSIIGVCMCFVAAGLGFAGALLNPFTIGIAQGISNLPLFSGIEYRFICWIIINIVGITFILRYASKIKKNPKLSIVYDDDLYWRKQKEDDNKIEGYHTPKTAWISFLVLSIFTIIMAYLHPKTFFKLGLTSSFLPILPIISGLFIVTGIISLRKSVHFYILNLLLFTIIYLIIGVIGYNWYVMEIATLFFVMGLFAGIAMNNSPNKITKLFLDGMKDIMSAAVVVGLAGGIIIILNNAKIVDTLLYGASKSMNGLGKVGTSGIMYAIQTVINLFMPSGSAKAALTMPMMSQFSDLIGLSRQVTVLAYQFGDGFTNMITPTSGVLLGVLSVARIPFDKWVKWIFPLMIILIIIGFLLIIPPLYIKFNGF